MRETIIKTTLYLYATEGTRPEEFENVDFDGLSSDAPSGRRSYGGTSGRI